MQAVAYEACRLFKDCLTTPEHASTSDSILVDALRKHWGTAVDASGVLFTTVGAVSTASSQLFLLQPTHVMLAALACALRNLQSRTAQCIWSTCILDGIARLFSAMTCHGSFI